MRQKGKKVWDTCLVTFSILEMDYWFGFREFKLDVGWWRMGANQTLRGKQGSDLIVWGLQNRRLKKQEPSFGVCTEMEAMSFSLIQASSFCSASILCTKVSRSPSLAFATPCRSRQLEAPIRVCSAVRTSEYSQTGATTSSSGTVFFFQECFGMFEEFKRLCFCKSLWCVLLHLLLSFSSARIFVYVL
jgi:hypothetical protein